jgi:TonB family protein
MNPLQCATKLHLLYLALIFSVISPSSFVFGQAGQAWGQPENGLQLLVSPVNGLPTSSSSFRFRLEIRNVGSIDLLIELGLMQTNGQKQYPNALSAFITNPKGETLECGYPGPFGAFSGLIGPLIVPLPADASFALPVDLEKWTQNWKSCTTQNAYIPLNMPSGQYAFRIQYAAKILNDHRFGPYGGQIVPPIPGAPTSTVAIEWAGQILNPVWIGTATSNQVEFQWPPHSAAELPRVAASPPPLPPNITRIRVARDVQAAKLLFQPEPEYPPLAKMARIQGIVRLDAVINQDGTVQDLRVISGHPLLVKAALDAVPHWRYQPTLLNGAQVEVATEIDVNFALPQ